MGKPNESVAEDAPVSLSDIESAIKPAEAEISLPTDKPADAEAKPEKKPSKWVDDEDAEEFERLRKILHNGLGQLNSGFPPELLYAGGKMSYLMMKHGVRKFAEYATAMIEELGDAIRPHLKSLYNFTRSTEEVMESEWADELTPFDEVMKFDTANFGKPNVDAMATAENVVAEEASQQHLEDAVNTIKDSIRQNPDGSTSQTINEGGTEIEVTEGDFIPGVYPPIDDKPTKPGKKKPSKSKPTEQKPTTGQLDLFEEEEEQIINDIIDDTTPPEPKPEAELSGDSADYQERTRQERDLVDDIVIEIMKRTDMRERGDEKVTLTMRDIRGMLENYSLLADISATDLQELVERAMTILTRTAAKTYQLDPRKGYDRVVAYYNMQPSLNARDSERLIKQQYSTPTPFGYVMGQFVNAKNDAKSILEPSAGNGALTIMFNPATVHVNDIDERRLENLRTLGYGTVTAQNGLLPFEGEKVDGVLTNPPFGSVTEKVYDGVFKISSLEGQMAINALDSMKDGGRAAIIIGGNTSYRTNGSMNPKDAAFFGYLYSHYNVSDVINISGKALYARNGTGYDVRMILINGRKTGEFSRVYPPVKSKARAEQVTTFDELYKRVQDDIQQVFQMGNKPADVQPEAESTADGGTSTPVRSGGNNPNKGARERPDTTGYGSGSASGSNIEQPSSGNGGSRPVGVDNGDAGNAGGTDNVQRPQSSASGSNGSGSPQNDGGRSGGNGRDAASSRPNSNGERLAVKPDLTTEKVPYPNQSDNGFTLLSVVPAAQAEVLQRSLAEIGDVDQFLVDELGYSSKEELYSYLAAEQIDSVALAIHQMNKGNAFIIGDMTGVGKGRQGAALIRYGVRQGRCPIYFTQKPTLFTDNYRDLADIGSSELRPFIIASNPKDANIVDANGNVVHKLPSKKEQERVFDYIMQNGKLPKEYDYVLTTYDQIKNGTADYSQNEDGTWNTEARKLPKKSKGYTTADYNGQARRDALARLAMGVAPGEGNIAILDESHTVGGDSGCGRYMQMLTSGAYGVTFLSATFAKRADNMPIYAQRTAIAEAGVNANELIEAIAKGGVTLQEIMSKQLVESGQMIRRERSFEGVTIDWLSVEEETDRKQREQFNEVANIFNSIRNFQNDFIKPIIDGMNEDAAETGGTVGQTQGTKDMGVRNTPFASKMYNLVNQLLFALKVDAVADRVIENLSNGFKPVISFTNTMEGFLASAPKGVAMDEVPNFSLTLMRALDGVMRFTENDADQNSEGGQITVGQLSPEGQAAYNAIKGKIMNLSADLPISPMDAIRMKIEEAGYTVAEITGRTTQLNRTEDGRYIVEGRKDRDKKAAMRDFNAGKLDVLMINKSGSTGISLHASSKFEDQRQRVMVFAQFQSDINDEVQMRGRIDRSGQVVRGRYEYIMSTIPAEQRIQMMFKAKLKSLDANTTSSQKSKFNEMEIVDYLNKYGDEVVWEYMKEHPELSDRLGDPLKMLQDKDEDGAARTSEKEDSSQKSDCAGKISRYLAFLSVEEQDEIFKEITEAYKVKIQLLDDAGENDLEITTMPLRAETKSKQIWHNGENPGSGNAFADNTYVEEVEVDVLKKPMKRTEIEDMTRKLMGDKITTATEYDQTRYGMKDGELNWGRYADKMIEEVNNFFGAKVDDAVAKMKEAGEKRVSKAREKAVKDAIKARAKGENTFSDQEIEALADVVAKEAQDKEEMKQYRRREEINNVRDQIKHLLSRLRAGHIYVVPQDLKQATADMFTQTFGTFVGFKFNKSYTLGSSTAIFATLDGRRKVELALNDKAIETIIRCTDTALRYSPKEINAISMDNWDSKVPTKTRQTRHIITGNLLQALVDTEKGEKTKGNLISFSTNDGNTRQGILMSENFKPTDLRSSVPLRSRLKQIQDGITVVSENGDVQIERVDFDWKHRGEYELKVPKSKQRGGIYSMHTELLKLIDGHNFNSKGNNMVGYVLPENLAKVVDMLSSAPFNLTVLEESKLTETTDSSQRNVEDDSDLRFRIREEEPPKQTGIGYEPQKRQTGAITDEQINELNSQFAQRERDGYGAYSDAEVSMENDPWSKAWGESIRTKRQQKQFAERERKRMRDRAKSLSSVLGIDIEVIEDASSLKGKKQRAKGWYDTKTGKITVVVGNHNSAADMEATILHEAVAHHGLRQLLGEHFDEFLDKVYEAADNGIKEQIDLLASRNGWNRRVATEEYLAGLAEETEFDRAEERVGGWFDKIKRFFIDMLFKAGFKHIKPGSIGDNELRYILWRSYQNLANPGRYRAFEWEAEDVAMQHKLQVGQYDTTSEKVESAADSGIRFRDGDFTPRDRKLAADVYEKMLSRGSWQFREATQDSMLGLKTLYESILGSNTRIENVAGHENAYLYENRMSSANNGEQHQYFSRFMKPLLESIHKLCGSKELDRRILTDYMMAKHGLERNEYMRNEAAANGEDTERDFAGLCGLTGEDDWQVAETVAQQMVDDYEADHNTAELWNNVKKATNATLEKIYLSGLISEDTYNKVLGMYDFYIPLRGWDETTSDEVYGYLTSKDGPLIGNVFKKAGGRNSKADDPIATIAMMADDAIRQGNRNIMKQRFLNFVHGNPSDLVSVNEMWLQHNDVTDEWEPVFADLQPNMTHAEVESEIAKFEAKMEALRTAEPDKYKKGGDARNIPYKVVRGNLNEHQVLVKRNGRTYVITINGNPRAAQALNGLTNPNVEMGGVIGNILKLGEYVNRHLSAFYTTRNPDFVVSNFMRDMLYSNCMTWVKENPRYALRFHKNFGKVNPLTLRRLLSKWENDNLSDSNYLEKMFKEFMLNGGETGYTSVKDIEGHKRTIASELKKQGSTGRKAWSALGMQLDLLNRSAENCARFAAFLTSREMGRTLDRSIYDAKEVSVNFNKKGSGGKFVNATGQKLLGKIGSYLGGGGRIAFVFWNVGIQGMTNFGRAGKRNPGKAIGGDAALFTLGYVIPLLAQMLGGGDGDDDDKNAYYNLPEYVRRSNICFKAGEQWITIPLPIEYRAIYGMGELACGVISGNERYSNSELTRQMASQISQVMPLDMLEGGGGISPFIPSAFKPFTEAYIMNKGWTGLPVYKDTPYNKNDPEWTKAYQSADQHLVAFTRWLNETSGGDDYKKGAIDINPAKLEYLLSGTFGGAVSTTGKLKKMGETFFGDREFEWRNMLLANRVIKSGDERTANRKLQNEYYKYLTEYEETNRLRKKYENAADDGILGYAERADFLYNSPEYLRFEIFEKYKSDIDAIREEIKEETNPEAKKELQEELFSTMRELVDELHDVGK
ncbi:LPD38 domain-containing protein [Muribaculum intestinale]|uniref:LPD38 domain-containing protein n=1 Tax=Muribaculum intestinale TaxID=1796646 RepID=UPI00272C0713|nr:LPD38 domain-containing protein [Muribaculum intestinale]